MELEFRLRLMKNQLHNVITTRGLGQQPVEQLRWRTLDSLGFSARIVHALNGRNIRTVHDLTNTGRSRLMRIRNIGATSMREIDRFLMQHGLQLKD